MDEAMAIIRFEENAAGGRTEGEGEDRPVQRLTYSVDEAAEVLGISRASAYEAIRKGEIPHIKIGKRILIPRVMLDDLLALWETVIDRHRRWLKARCRSFGDKTVKI